MTLEESANDEDRNIESLETTLKFILSLALFLIAAAIIRLYKEFK
jgi:hypothetical protein